MSFLVVLIAWVTFMVLGAMAILYAGAKDE